MKIGTKSLLYGAHQVVLHPIFVLFGWIWLFGLPSLGELIAIIIHDWGYFGKPNMDGEEGRTHPEAAAKIFEAARNPRLAFLCRGHSRFWARKIGISPSKLCYADKLGTAMMPGWLWAALVWTTGEFVEYKLAEEPILNGEPNLSRITMLEWFRRYRLLTCRIIGDSLCKLRRD